VYGTLPQLIRRRPALGAIGYIFFISVANDNLFVIYGAWLEASFRLGIVALGMATTVIGVAELLGEVLTATLADRLGLRRLISVGAGLCALSYLALPTIGQTLPLALISLFIVFLTFEFSIVTSLSLATEFLPEARATMMAGYLAGASVGRVFGAIIGGPVWLMGGIVSIGWVSAFITLMGLISLWYGLKGWRPMQMN
jgi:predicted MFS family arabinose efflux permease